MVRTVRVGDERGGQTVGIRVDGWGGGKDINTGDSLQDINTDIIGVQNPGSILKYGLTDGFFM